MSSKIIGFAGLPGAGKDTAAEYLRTMYPNICTLKFAEPLQDVVALIEGNYDAKSFNHRVLFNNSIWKNKPIIDMDILRNDKVVRQAILTNIVKVLCNVKTDTDRKLNTLHTTFSTVNCETTVYCGDYLYELIDSAWDNVFTERYYSPREVQKLFGTNLARELIDKDIWVGIMREKLSLIRDTQLVLITDLRYPNEYDLVIEFGGKLVYVDNSKALKVAMEVGLLNHASEQNHDFLKQKAWYKLINELTSEYFEEVDRMYHTFLQEFSS